MRSRAASWAIGTAVAVLSVVASATPAHADATLFAGTLAFGSVRPTVGVAVGKFGELDLLGWEVEVGKTLQDGPVIYAGSFLLQSAVVADKLRVYGTFGLGLYGSGGAGQLGFGSVGGGTKIQVADGPFWLRLDYRLFLHGNDTPERLRYPQRATAGVSLAF